MIHRAILGSIERMMAILTEQYKGDWPFWLSPRQILIIGVGEDSMEYVKQVKDRLSEFEVEVDASDETLAKKVKRGESLRFNYIVVVGEKERESGDVDVRERGSREHSRMSLVQFRELLVKNK